MRLTAAILALVTLAPALHAAEPIALHVKTAQATGGFTDPDKGRADSMKNIVDKLKESTSVRLVNTPDEAVILLEVLGRKKEASRSMWGRKENTAVAVQVTAGEFTAEFTGESSTNKGFGNIGNWGRAAGQVVKQLDAWVLANQEPLQKLAGEKAAAAPAAN